MSGHVYAHMPLPDMEASTQGGCPVSWSTIHLLACHQPDLISLLSCHLLKCLTGTGRDWRILEPLTWGCELSMVYTKMRHHSDTPPIRDHHVSGLRSFRADLIAWGHPFVTKVDGGVSRGLKVMAIDHLNNRDTKNCLRDRWMRVHPLEHEVDTGSTMYGISGHDGCLS